MSTTTTNNNNQSVTSIFTIDSLSGDIRIGTEIFHQPEGVFIINAEAQETDSHVSYANLFAYVSTVLFNFYMKLLFKVHHINSSSKLKYVFAEPLDTLGIVLDEFIM
jgi:hypothetical protein